ncbi:MAG: ATP-binding cassette domain-containing protein [Cyanobacteria bacterium SZAS-4]|nr:ATP-binding cassette domain-containing protein [Cyanobacteria bacterium SZAS-4]
MSDIVVDFRGIGKCYNSGERRGGRGLLSGSMFQAERDCKKAASQAVWALKNVSFQIRDGEVVGFIGPNGAGKSTLLKILARITKPTTGVGKVKGRVGSLLEVGSGFHPELTGRENIFLNGSILGMTRQEISRKFDEIVEFSGVGSILHRPVKQYSSGEYMRLGFAVASHLESEILILDEVLAVGDGAFKEQCQRKIHSLTKEGCTILFVSHRMDQISELCDKVIWLDKGSLIDFGDTRSVIGKYESTFAVGSSRR